MLTLTCECWQSGATWGNCLTGGILMSSYVRLVKTQMLVLAGSRRTFQASFEVPTQPLALPSGAGDRPNRVRITKRSFVACERTNGRDFQSGGSLQRNTEGLLFSRLQTLIQSTGGGFASRGPVINTQICGLTRFPRGFRDS